MDIEEYLAQKRTLEKKKESLEVREKLKRDSDDKKKEFSKELQRPILARDQLATQRPVVAPVGSGRPPMQPSSAPPSDYHDPMRKMIMWNMLLLLVVVVMGIVLFFTLFNNNKEAPVVVQQPTTPQTPSTGSGTNQTPATPDTDSKEEQPKYYDGPAISFSARDYDKSTNTGLGSFDARGRLPDGGILTISTGYYDDLELQITNEEATRAICFIDRAVKLDEDFDGTYDLEDVKDDFIVTKLSAGETETLLDKLPGQFEEGTYENKGNIYTEYEASCYYCANDECKSNADEEGYDPYGETKASVVVRLGVNPPEPDTNSTG